MRTNVATKRAISAILSIVLLVPSVSFADRTVRCESSGYRYARCDGDTHGRVTLMRQISHTHCREGENWGYDSRGIWVDRGCAADFNVPSGSSGSGHKAAAVGAAVVGIAVLAALASRNDDHDTDVASWAVGNSRGYDEFERSTVELNILPGGSVTGNAGRHDFTGKLSGSDLQAGRQRFRIERSGNGFVASDVNNAGHRVVFTRAGGGY